MATTFVRAANPIWWLPDLTGVSLNDEYYAFFLTNTLPYIPQAVYQTSDTVTPVPWSDPVQFSPAGTLPDNLYFDPSLVYRIEVRHGNTQTDELIWEIQNFVPGQSPGPIITDELTVAANLITNPQFADISFQSPLTYAQTPSGTYTIDIGPGWQLIMIGANGSTTITQVPNAGIAGVAGNPPYYLEIQNSGWTTVILQQRLENNGALFGGGAVAVAFTAASVGTAEVLTVSYEPSTGTEPNIYSSSIPVGSLTPYKNAVDLPASSNFDSGTAAYVNINFTMQGTSHLLLTNVQITGQTTNLSSGFNNPSDAPDFRELSYEQVVNNEFNVYQDWLSYKPIPSYLVGWDFPLNPAQFHGSTLAAQATGANTSFYVWDQTIVFQSADSGANFSRDVAGAFTINAEKSSQFAVIQYLDQTQARKLLNQTLSVHLSALSTIHTVKVTVSLWYTSGSALPDLNSPNYKSIVATLDADGKPATFNNPTAGTWTELKTKDGQTLSTTVGFETASGFNDYEFTGYELNDFTTANGVTYFAIVIGTAEMANLDTLHINSVSLCHGNIATRPAPQTADEVLRECQYFYEKSYDLTDTPGTVQLKSALVKPMLGYVSGGTTVLYPTAFSVDYKQAKRIAVPGFSFYSTAFGTQGSVSGQIWSNNYTDNASVEIVAGTTWQPTYGQNTAIWLPLAGGGSYGATGSALPAPVAAIYFHYVVDCRLGIV